jgi:hypothetical protein
MALTDTLDDLIGEQRIDPQLAMKILSHFDRVIAETLAEKVKARLSFKVGCRPRIAALALARESCNGFSTLSLVDHLLTHGICYE